MSPKVATWTPAAGGAGGEAAGRGVGRPRCPRRVRTVFEQPVVDPLSGGRAVAQQQRGAGREHFKVPEWTEGASEHCAHHCVELRGEYRVPTMLDGPVVETHIFAFDNCAA